MTDWIVANAGSLIVSAILILLVFLAVRSIVKRRKTGGCSCGCCSPDCPNLERGCPDHKAS